MLLVSKEEYQEIQEYFLPDFLKSLEIIESDGLFESSVYDMPRDYINKLLKVTLIGSQHFNLINILVSNIMNSDEYLDFFKVIHTKQEILDFLKVLIKEQTN